ncbi:hypothetical protein MYSTI_02489 [Myxococcus stipitatus DSM 14675]|uniref:Lipoprotein n=1 Tax=Myxococcus stipitatus (strain DSM 14675 / JCM 12634 / Mx s8) TaxID=1278073 RepID=L7U7J2_MYXSD|nr:DUF6289 family protein [Myxococcus stipitatus]AGC43805.1 hypothetical protein MYSTI_02489 [Myxococcus stipitatus DSM 14675]
MRFNQLTRGLGLAAALLAVACGGPEAAPEPQEADMSHHAEAPPPCDSTFQYNYYSDATLKTLVGIRTCSCGIPLGRWGVVTAFEKVVIPDTACENGF